MARSDEVGGHGRAHVAQPDETDPHRSGLDIDGGGESRTPEVEVVGGVPQRRPSRNDVPYAVFVMRIVTQEDTEVEAGLDGPEDAQRSQLAGLQPSHQVRRSGRSSRTGPSATAGSPGRIPASDWCR